MTRGQCYFYQICALCQQSSVLVKHYSNAVFVLLAQVPMDLGSISKFISLRFLAPVHCTAISHLRENPLMDICDAAAVVLK